jgi:SWI/SNF-related matrix-associated actin-dependent regulator 1 of chromatin subfamily A
MESNKDKLSKIPEVRAQRILEDYDGFNNYIQSIQKKFREQKHFKITRAQSDYINTYHNLVPKIARKWVDLDSYFGKKMMEDKLLTKVPEKVYIEKLLVEKEKSFHIWCKIFENEKLHSFWLPRVALIKSQETEKVEINYEKYSHRPPLEHQIESIEKLVSHKKYILADDMGLGKTTSTVIAALESGVERVLIVCPASLKINWKREIQNYTEKSISIVEGKKWESADFVIMNYDILKNFHNIKNKEESIILQEGFDLVVVDEAHYIQNVQAKRTKLINDIINSIGKVWLLTGTPMTSRPINYYNLLNLVESPVAYNWMAYVIRYCEGYQFNVGNRRVWNVNGSSNLTELRDRTQTHVLRRLKKDILDLPDKIITPVYLNLKSKEYVALMGEYYDWVEDDREKKSLTVQFSMLMKIRQIIAESKIKETCELIENIIEQGKKVIVFTNFTNTLNQIADHFGKKAVKLDGKMNKISRQNSVDQFQENDKVRVFVGKLKAAGVGITLTAGEGVIMFDLYFVGSVH